MAAFALEEYESAKSAFEQGLHLADEAAKAQFRTWIRKCDAELENGATACQRPWLITPEDDDDDADDEPVLPPTPPPTPIDESFLKKRAIYTHTLVAYTSKPRRPWSPTLMRPPLLPPKQHRDQLRKPVHSIAVQKFGTSGSKPPRT